MNRFRDPTMRQQYDGARKAYEVKHRDLFVNGARRRSLGSAGGGGYGSSFAELFWKGFDNVGASRWDRASRRMIGYACWRAGRDIAVEIEKAAKEAA